MSLRADVAVERGEFALHVAAEVGEGEILALVGPSGAGKTTFLHVVAGLLAARSGRVEIGGDVVDDPDAGVFVPVEQRRVGWLPQGGALFPHLDAAGNVAFGLRSRRRGRGRGRGDARREAEGWLEAVGLADRCSAPVATLSGGEARRVALARALAPAPEVVLLDEPFTGLDPAARADLRRVVRTGLAGRGPARVVVVHEPLDALTLADRVVVVEGGRVVQQGTPAELCRDPRSRYVAELAGLNLLHGDVVHEEGRTVLRSAGGDVQVASDVRGPAVAVIRPAAVAIYREPPAGSPRNVLDAVVAEVTPGRDRVRVYLDGRPPLVAELTAEAAGVLALEPGVRVHAVVKATEIDVSEA